MRKNENKEEILKMSDHEKVYGVCENKCFVEVNSKDEVKKMNLEVNERVDQANKDIQKIAGSQIPQSTIINAVNTYVSEHSAGFATEEELSELKTDIKDKFMRIYQEFAYKGWVNNDWVDTTSKRRLATNHFKFEHKKIKVSCADGFQVFMSEHDTDGSYITRLLNWDEGESVVMVNKEHFYAIGIRKIDDSNLLLTDSKNVIIGECIEKQSDEKKNFITLKDLNIEGMYVNANGFTKLSANNHMTDLIPVKKGDIVKYKLKGVTGVSLISFYDKNEYYHSTLVSGINATFVEGECVINNDGFIIATNRYDSDEEAYLYVGDLQQILENEKVIPKYYEKYLEEKIETINNVNADIGEDGDCFAMITDMHWSHNAKISPRLINYICDNSHINKVVNCGDLVKNYFTVKQDARNENTDLIRQFSKTYDYYITSGNHDNNSNLNSDTSTYLANSELYSYFVRRNEDKFTHVSGLSYCVDNKVQKIRYIFVDYFEWSNGCTVLKEWCNELDNTWNVVFFSHAYFTTDSSHTTGEPAVSGRGAKIKEAIDSIANKVNVVGLFTGHIHRDYILTTEQGYPIIATNCDTYAESAYWGGETMRLGTVTEQCFDIVSIDTENRKIYLTRIGAGSDRETDY